MRRVRQIERFSDECHEIQLQQLTQLLDEAKNTEYGRKHGFARLQDINDFKKAVPLVRYEDLRPYIMQMVEGKSDVLWRGVTRNFAQSSGTSDGKSKYVPITKESFSRCHYRGGVDCVALYLAMNPQSRIFDGKAFILWSKKLPPLVEASRRQNVTNISGVPSWFLSVIKEVMRREGVESIHDVWHNLEVFFHGGISFKPYRSQYESITDKTKMHFVETYNASEGFFAVQSSPDSPAMLLLLDLGVFYEFIPLSDVDSDNPQTLTARDVEPGHTYELVITACNGLWRYRIGDTVRVEQTMPLKITIAGRTKHFINAFGEELMVHNADAAIERACRQTGAAVANYTVAPVYATATTKGRHEWLIEFDRRPADMEAFADLLDRCLQQENSDYEAKRFQGIFIDRLSIMEARRGLFDDWLLQRSGKLGGQRKIPRLYNSRDIIDSMLEINKQSKK